jgi:hypothetical protein
VHGDRLRELSPDVIVTQEQCQVCAVSTAEVEAATCEWLGSRPRIVSLEPNSLADIWRDVQRVADALGAPERGRELVTRLRARMDEIAGRVPPARPRVATVEWIDPLMTGGNWMPELVELAGGVNLFGEAGKHSPYLGWGDLVRADPDVIVVTPCGWGWSGRGKRWARTTGAGCVAGSFWRTATSTSIAPVLAWSSRWRSWRRSCTPSGSGALRPRGPGRRFRREPRRGEPR